MLLLSLTWADEVSNFGAPFESNASASVHVCGQPGKSRKDKILKFNRPSSFIECGSYIKFNVYASNSF